MSTKTHEIANGITVVTNTPEEPVKPPEGQTPQLKIPTPEELRQRTIDLYATMGWGKPPEPKADDTPTPQQPVSPAVSPEPGRAAEPPAPGTEQSSQAPPQPPAEPEPEPELSTAEIIARSARETAREVARAIRPNEPAAAPTTEEPKQPDLTADDAEDLKALQYLERTDPKRYAGASKKFLEYVQARYAYETKWAQENPDKQFNPDEEEHLTWATENQPDIDVRELDNARLDMKVEERVEARLKPAQEREAAEKAFQRELPSIAQTVNRSIIKLVSAVDGNLGKIISDEKGAPKLTEESIALLDKTDPIASEVMNEIVAHQLEPLILELEKTQIPELHYRLEPQNNPVHEQITRFVTQKEQEMSEAPAAAKELNGKQWVSLAEFAQRANAIQRARGSEADKRAAMERLNNEVWTLSVEDIQELLIDNCAKQARKIIEKRDGAAKKKYSSGSPNGTPISGTPPAKPQETPPGPTPAGFKPKPPSLSGGAEVVTTRVPGTAPQKSFGETAADVMFGH